MFETVSEDSQRGRGTATGWGGERRFLISRIWVLAYIPQPIFFKRKRITLRPGSRLIDSIISSSFQDLIPDSVATGSTFQECGPDPSPDLTRSESKIKAWIFLLSLKINLNQYNQTILSK